VPKKVLRDALAAVVGTDADGLGAAALAGVPLGVLDRDPLGNRKLLTGYADPTLES
jgi:hypothetical protein